MNLDAWAAQWNVPAEALMQLRVLMGVDGRGAVLEAGEEGSESRQQSLVRIDAAQNGVWLTRNNVGALLNPEGVPVRYGLANESKVQNEKVKSADLIGMRSIIIGPHHVGQMIAQFVSREVKHEGWKFTGTAREVAQLAWCNFVLSKGGDAAFVTGPGSFNNKR